MWGIRYGGVHGDPGREAAPAPPAGDRAGPGDRRPVSRRRPLHRRLRDGQRAAQYAVSQVAMNAMPPDPSFRGEAWRDEWRARLEATPPWLIEWLRQQTDGPYWRPGSLAPDYDADRRGDPEHRRLDATRTSTRRSGCRRAAPRRRGRWSATGSTACPTRPPGPNLDELHEIVRFFDRWLRAIGTASTTSPRSSGSSATTRSRRRSRSRGRDGGAAATPTRIPATRDWLACVRGRRRRRRSAG